jgi:peptidoglycan-N-acetylglucosamine deacetylase
MMRLLFAASIIGKVIAIGAYSLSPWLAAAFFFGPDLFLLDQLFVPSAQGLGRVYTRFATTRREVWLTIDDGPDEEDTPRILDLLDRHGARATFFVIGERVARHPELVSEILKRGHDVAHHTQTHPIYSFWCASPARVRREIGDGLETLRMAGATPRWFRPPVGTKNFFLHAALAARKLDCVSWSIRSRDAIARDPAPVVARVLKSARPGAIILMHEGAGVHPRVRVTAIAGVLQGLQSRGFACVLPQPGDLRPA